jgi:hypothetical protein
MPTRKPTATTPPPGAGTTAHPAAHDCQCQQGKNPPSHCCCCHGKSTAPNPCADNGPRACPPPHRCPQPGTVDIPQDTPPYQPGRTATPPWKDGKPKPGDGGEIPWFRGKVRDILRNGPKFGPRKDEFLPYVMVRTASGDTGNRPFSGVFWESPDIYVAPNVDAGVAPLAPPTTAGVARANAPNTLYAHVWNLGNAPAYRVRVEFYWFNPSLGISRSDANLIGAAYVDLGDRANLFPSWRTVRQSYGTYLSRGSHAIVRCPTTWVPTFENNGHECLVVRAFEPMLDTVSPNQFSASSDRHVAQRNIAVVLSSSPASIDMALDLGYAASTGEANVEVSVEGPTSMEWLKLYTGKRDPGLVPATAPVVTGLMPPTPVGTRVAPVSSLPFDNRASLLRTVEKFPRGCEPLRVPLHASVADLKKNQAQVVRVRQTMNGDVIGGYSVVLLGR